MTNLDKALNTLADNIKAYRTCDLQDGDELLRILQRITGVLHYLETERAKCHNTFQTRVGKLILEGNSVARSENIAHTEIPEMYMLRHVMSSGYEVVNAIRSTVSWLKSEKQSII